MFKQPWGRLISWGALFCAVWVSAASPPPTISTQGVTLADCYRKALEMSERVGISAENTRLLQEQYRTQIGAILPHIDWIKTQFYQQEIHKAESGFGGSALRSTQPESYFQLLQPIFAGFRDWDETAILKSQRTQSKINEQITNLQLLSDVSEAFYTAFTLQDTVHVLQDTRKLNQNQIDQLSKWTDIGRSRPSEVLSAQTQGAALDAQIEDAQRTLVEARHNLLYLAGIPMDVPLVDNHQPNRELTLEEALSRAGKRPEIQYALETLRQAQLGRSFARGGHYPTLTLLGRYYTERVGFLSDIKWDATFTLDVPLYEGGSTQASVRAARSQEIIAQLELRRLQRDVERQVRTAYDNLIRSLSKTTAYDKAVDLAQKNYQTQQKEYRLGVISNLELLQLLSNTEDLRRLALISRAGCKIDDIRLRIAMGESI